MDRRTRSWPEGLRSQENSAAKKNKTRQKKSYIAA